MNALRTTLAALALTALTPLAFAEGGAEHLQARNQQLALERQQMRSTEDAAEFAKRSQNDTPVAQQPTEATRPAS